MEKKQNKKILNIVTLCILIIVPFLKFFSMNLELFGIIKNYDFINPAIVLWVSIPFLIYVYIKDISDTKRKLNIFDYLFYILLVVGIISVVFSINKRMAILGTAYRHEGFLSVLSYYLLFINWKCNGTSNDLKKYIKILVIMGILNSIYSLFQMYTKFPFILRFEHDQRMASGFCGNPNFFGSLIVTVLSIVVCNFIMKNKINIKEILLIVLLFISLMNCQSTGPFLTFVLVLVFLLIYLRIKNKLVIKKLLILLLVLITSYISIYFVNKLVYENNRCETCIKELKETINNGGNGRLEIWKNSLKIVKDYPITGVGFDNFELVYPNPKIENSFSFSITSDRIYKSQPVEILIYDNAHNVYLHTLVTTGILGVIPYLTLCLLTFIKGLKSKNEQVVLLLSGFVAYSIQAFANISVIQVAPIYYIIIGLILSSKEEPNKTSNI